MLPYFPAGSLGSIFELTTKNAAVEYQYSRALGGSER